MTAALRLISTSTVPARSAPALTGLQAQVYRQVLSEGRPCGQLMTWLLDRRNLDSAWDRVRAAEGAATPGVDGVTCPSIQEQSNVWLGRLADDLYHRRYRPADVRWIEVPKPNRPGATRRLGILTIRDRVVHAALKQLLEPLLEPVFLDSSFGFRPGRSVPGALAEALRRLSGPADQPPPFAAGVHLDVADCFDTVDQQLLMKELERHTTDADLLRLLEQILVAGGTHVMRFFRRRYRGLVQGSSLSPLLCNLALHPLDEALAEFGRDSQGGLTMLRYADDLLLLGRDVRLAQKGVACVRQVLANLHQRLRDPHAAPTALTTGLTWLGVRLQPQLRPWTRTVTFGYVVPEDRVAAMLQRLTEMTTPPSDRIEAGAFNLGRWVVSINEQLRDWRQAYLFADNATEVFRAIDEHTRERMALLVQAVTGARAAQLYAQYRVRLPRGFWTWQVEGTRLVCLSSLAPHNPVALTRRPPWMRRDALPAAEKPAADAATAGS